MSENLKDEEINKSLLLAKINQTMMELGSTAKYKKVPEFIKEYESLRNKTVVMVDDVDIVLQNYAAELIVASGGKAYLIEYKSQSLEELVSQILKYKPDIVLMDFNLSEDLKGTEVIRALKNNGFHGESVGFSSDSEAARQFAKVQAIGTVDKSLYPPEETIKIVANLFSKK